MKGDLMGLHLMPEGPRDALDLLVHVRQQQHQLQHLPVPAGQSPEPTDAHSVVSHTSTAIASAQAPFSWLLTRARRSQQVAQPSQRSVFANQARLREDAHGEERALGDAHKDGSCC